MKLTKSEINHLLTLIEFKKQDGSYWGNRKQFDKRTEKLITKLNNAKKELI